MCCSIRRETEASGRELPTSWPLARLAAETTPWVPWEWSEWLGWSLVSHPTALSVPRGCRVVWGIGRVKLLWFGELGEVGGLGQDSPANEHFCLAWILCTFIYFGLNNTVWLLMLPQNWLSFSVHPAPVPFSLVWKSFLNFSLGGLQGFRTSWTKKILTERPSPELQSGFRNVWGV